MIFVDDQEEFGLNDMDAHDGELGSIQNLQISSGSGDEETTIELDEYNVPRLFGDSPSVLYNSTFYLNTVEEASLFRHFLDWLGPWVSPSLCPRSRRDQAYKQRSLT